ncbi:cuticle protein AMP1A-like [Penaeus indicus]|uniref:cuticle protein AMP1A-like n=1 Tax=Penaeus indicus TaxID=29960 RepID=UPI00300C8138
MKLVILALVATAASAATLYDAPRPQVRALDSGENVAILRDDRLIDDEGKYNFDFETANGISVSESGSPVGEDGAINSAGSFSYTAPDGTPVHVEFVADERGFQPQSDLLPVAP